MYGNKHTTLSGVLTKYTAVLSGLFFLVFVQSFEGCGNSLRTYHMTAEIPNYKEVQKNPL